jgi:hypothetical protein
MIPPALQDHEWRNGQSTLRDTGVVLSLAGELGLLIEGAQHITIGRNVARLTALIALANAAMSDDDPHKLKRAHVDALRAVAEGSKAGKKEAAVLGELANAIESYLPR